MPSKKSPACRAFGNAIRATRRGHGYTQESFAAHAGLDRSYVGAIERGQFNISLDTIVKIAAGLDITATELFRRAKL
ncbi:MAG TPA: helix-turn-helix transcriptional regulator [Solirubrobacteraceae bacterium]|jgi:transcriptional regulator with XRE-family HTH domain|nr:helix-turn-helix transcriptional regulator [Solirubrobacteraceae bacterium]